MRRTFYTRAAALNRGFQALTEPIELPAEKWIVDSIVATLAAGGVEFCLVRVPAVGVEVWRKNMKTRADVLSAEKHEDGRFSPTDQP